MAAAKPKPAMPNQIEVKASTRYQPFWDPLPGAETVYEQFAAPGPWERVRLGDLWLPGICTVDAGKGRELDVVKGPGETKEKLYDTGVEPGEILIVCLIWTPVHFERYAELARALELGAGTREKRKAVDIYHPALDALGVSSVYPTALTAPRPVGRGQWEFTLRTQRFLPRKTGKDTTPVQVKESATSVASTPTAFDDKLKAAPSTTGAGPK